MYFTYLPNFFDFHFRKLDTVVKKACFLDNKTLLWYKIYPSGMVINATVLQIITNIAFYLQKITAM